LLKRLRQSKEKMRASNLALSAREELDLLMQLSLQSKMYSKEAKLTLNTSKVKFGYLTFGLLGVLLAKLRWLITRRCLKRMLRNGVTS